MCSVLGCPKANAGQTVQQRDSKSSAGFIKRSAKTSKNDKISGATGASSNPVEGRQSAKRITRQNGRRGSVEDAIKLPVSKKGTATALMGGKRAGTAASNETRGETVKTQTTRRIAVEKPVGNSTSVHQRKKAKAKRTSEDTVSVSKPEGGSVKRRRVQEDSDETVRAEVEDVCATAEAVVRHSVVEEEIVETSEVSIAEDEPEPLDEEKKRRIEETQRLLKLISVDTVVDPATNQSVQNFSNQSASLQHAEKHRDDKNNDVVVNQSRAEETIQSKDLDVVAVPELKDTAGEVTTKEDTNNEVECRGSKSRKVSSDCAAGKFEEYFPPVDDTGSEVFMDGDDIENLLRIEQRCASVQSWVARRSHEELDMEPSVEQMDVEEEVTVEGGEVLLEHAAGFSPNSGGINGDSESHQTDESTLIKSTTAPLAAVFNEEAASDKFSDESANIDVLSRQAGVESSTTAVDENEAIQHSLGVNSGADTGNLAREESTGNFDFECSSLKESTASKDLGGAKNYGVDAENITEVNIPVAVTTETTLPAEETGDSDNDKESLSSASHTADGDTRESVGGIRTLPCSTASTDISTSEIATTKSAAVSDVVHFDNSQCLGTVEQAAANDQKSTVSDVPALIAPVSPSDNVGQSTPADADEDKDVVSPVTAVTAGKPSENAAEASLPAEQQDLIRSTDKSAGKSSSKEEHCISAEPEDAHVRSSEIHADTEAVEAGKTLPQGSSDTVVTSTAVAVQPAQAVNAVSSVASGAPAVSVVVARTFTSTVAGSGAPAVTSMVAAAGVPGFVGMPPVAIRAAVPGSPVGSVFVHVADPRQFAMHLQQQQQQGQVQAAQTPVFHIPTLSPQQGGGPPQIVMSPLSPQQVALLSSSMPATSQSPHQLVPAPRHVTLVTSGPRPQLLQQCLLTSAGPQPLTLLPAPQQPPPTAAAQSTSSSTSGATSTTTAAPVPVPHLAILSHALQAAGGTGTSTTAPTSGHTQPVALIAAGPNQAPVVRMTPAGTVIPRHPMSASSAMQHLTSAVQQTISLQQLQLSFAAAAAAAQQQQIRPPGIPIQRLPVLCTTQPTSVTAPPVSASSSSLAVVTVAGPPVVSMPVSPMVSVAASALTAFLKKDNSNMASQLLSPPPPTTIAKLSPHDVALKGSFCFLFVR